MLLCFALSSFHYKGSLYFRGGCRVADIDIHQGRVSPKEIESAITLSSLVTLFQAGRDVVIQYQVNDPFV